MWVGISVTYQRQVGSQNIEPESCTYPISPTLIAIVPDSDAGVFLPRLARMYETQRPGLPLSSSWRCC